MTMSTSAYLRSSTVRISGEMPPWTQKNCNTVLEREMCNRGGSGTLADLLVHDGCQGKAVEAVHALVIHGDVVFVHHLEARKLKAIYDACI